MSLHPFAIGRRADSTAALRPFESIEDEPTVEHDPDLIERYYRAQARRMAVEGALAREREMVEIARAELHAAALLDGPSYVHCTAPASSDGPHSVAV